MGGGARRPNILNPARYFEAISILALHETRSLDYYNKHNLHLQKFYDVIMSNEQVLVAKT